MTEQFTFTTSAAILKRLGDELIRDPQTAFFELIKNSYDADATEVHVKFSNTSASAGTVAIEDDGSGMTLEDVRDKWARAASENKIREPYTPKFRRRRLGAKGIGRFSLAKLGRAVKIKTKTADKPDQISFRLNFDDFTDDKNFDEMEIPYRVGPPPAGFRHGTILEISTLNESWGKAEIKKVRSQLALLIDPEKDDQSFRIVFDCPQYPSLSGLLENPIAGKNSHRVKFSIDQTGRHECEIESAGRILERIRTTKTPLSCGPVEGVLRYYKEGVKARERHLTEATDETHMGVKVYRDGCRVRPYGEESDDWLDVRSRRARGGGKYYVQPQALAGSVYINASANPELKDATNREAGMLESVEFLEFRAFVREHVDKLNDLLERETRSESQKQKRETVKKILDTVVQCLNREDSPAYKNYVEKLDRSKRGASGSSRTNGNGPIVDPRLANKEEWHCSACDASWRVLKGTTPTVCMEFAVNRQGEPRRVSGCGSSDIERARHSSQSEPPKLSGVISGEFALVAGRQVRVRVDYEMGENDDEFLIDEREIVVNGNHPAYKVAENLDQFSGKKYEIGDDVFVPALTVHITKNVCLAWAEFHFKESKDWTDFKVRYDTLQSNICASVRQQLGF